MLDLEHPHPRPSVARQVANVLLTHERRRPGLPWAAAPAEVDARDAVPEQVLRALRPSGRRLRVFEIGSAAVIGAGGIEGRVRVRIDDGRWSLATIEASLVAVLLQVEPGLPGADQFAAAFRLAAIDAERKVADVHAQAGAAA